MQSTPSSGDDFYLCSLRGEVGMGQPRVRALQYALRQGSFLPITVVSSDLVIFAGLEIFGK